MLKIPECQYDVYKIYDVSNENQFSFKHKLVFEFKGPINSISAGL